MTSTLNEEHPRVPSRGKSRFWKTLLPVFGPHGINVPPQRSIFELKVGGHAISKILSDKRRRECLEVLFFREMGVGMNSARILASRPLSHLRRIEKIWSSIVDCFICYDPKVLEYRDIFVSVCRRLFKVGAYDPELLSKWWKEFTNFYYIVSTSMKVREFPRFDHRNIFVDFLDIPDDVMPIFPTNKLEFQRLMSFCSARGLPPSTKKEESIAKFKALVSEPFYPDPDLVIDFRAEAERLGNACKGSINPFQWHFSINSAGSFFNSIEEGGAAGEFLTDFRNFYEESLPLVTVQVDTIFGPVMEYQNYPRWMTYFRHPRTWMSFAGQRWPGDQTRLSSLGIPRYDGIDQCFAMQTYYLAYLMTMTHIESGEPFPTRVEALPEGGGKVRTISMLPWYVKVFLTPFGHSFQEYLKREYDGNPCLYRKSPAWDAFCKMGDIWHEPGRHKFMVSDMTSCTDAYPHVLAESLIKGFLKGLGFDISLPMWDLLIRTILHPREAHTADDSFIVRRGILMGEPTTKSLLTIFMCCLRSLTFRRYKGFFDPVKLPKWFFFHIGGDDHLVHGPEKYLWSVMDTVLDSGFLVDKSKYGVTSIGFKYLQTPFYLKDMSLKTSLVFDKEGYWVSAYCDSVKVKLLSPDTKPHEMRNLLNPAIGKAHAIAKFFQWSREDLIYKRSIRNRFIWRMGRLLPSPVTEPKLSHLIRLPAEFGGLGLALDFEEEQQAIFGCPAPTKIFALRLARGEATLMDTFMARRITKNTRRFLPDEDKVKLEIFISENVESVEWSSLEESKLDLPFTTVAQRLQRKMIYSLEDLSQWIERLDSQLCDLNRVPQPHDISWGERYHSYWGEYEKYLVSLGYEPFSKDSSVDMGLTQYFESKRGLSSLKIRNLYRVSDRPFQHPLYPQSSDGRLYWTEYGSMKDVFQKWIPILNVYGLIRGTTGA